MTWDLLLLLFGVLEYLVDFKDIFNFLIKCIISRLFLLGVVLIWQEKIDIHFQWYRESRFNLIEKYQVNRDRGPLNYSINCCWMWPCKVVVKSAFKSPCSCIISSKFVFLCCIYLHRTITFLLETSRVKLPGESERESKRTIIWGEGSQKTFPAWISCPVRIGHDVLSSWGAFRVCSRDFQDGILYNFNWKILQKPVIASIIVRIV